MNNILRWLGTPQQWLDPKGFRLWSVVLVLLYALSGFFLAPWIIERMLPSMVERAVSRHASVADVRINPFVLSADIRGFRLDDTDGTELVGFDRLYINFQSTSLFHWAWTFAEIRLDGVKGRLVRQKNGETNIERLIEGIKPAAQPAQPVKSSPLRLIVGTLVLDKGAIEVLDRSRETPFDHTFGPINVIVHDLSTLPENKGTQQVVIDAGRGIKLAWKGNLALSPLQLTGHVTANGPLPVLAYDYAKDDVAFKLPSGDADIRFDYSIGQHANEPVYLDLSGIDVALRNLKVLGDDGSAVADMPLIHLQGGSFAWPGKKIHADRLLVDGLSASLVRAKNGELNVLHLLRHSGEPAAATPAPSPSAAQSGETPLADWDIGVGAFEVNHLKLDFEDDTLESPGNFVISDANASIQSLSNKPNASFPLDASVTLAVGGSLHVSGKVTALPSPAAQLEVSGSGIACRAAQPWVAGLMRVDVRDGNIGFDSKVDLEPSGDLGVTGNFSLSDLAIANAVQGNRLLGWQSVKIDRYQYRKSANRVEISTLDIDKPYADFMINKDRTTNVQQLVVKRDDVGKSDTTKQSGAAKPLEITLGRVRVHDGSADFSDHSLPLPFHAGIRKLGGTITTLSTATSEPARVHLQGQVGNWGLAQIHGAINPLGPTLKTDIGVVFRNIDFPDLSPYTIKFAGRRIASGRLDLNLRYKLDKGQLDGKNNIVIHDFKLGEKVNEPGALDLPLGLAVALLEDKDGKIDLDLPVTGDVDSPDFRISGVIMKAFSNVITSIVTSPFRLLGRLVGGGASEDFGEIDFEPGLADLSPPEKEKLAKLTKALSMRPALTLKVPGTVAPDLDAAAMRKLRMDKEIEALVAAASKTSKPALFAEVQRKAVETLFTRQFPKEPLATLQQQFTSAPKDQPDGKPKLDEQAYVASLRQKLIDAQVVTEGELAALAAARSSAIANTLTTGSGISAARVQEIAGKPARPTGNGWVPVKLDVAVSTAPAGKQR